MENYELVHCDIQNGHIPQETNRADRERLQKDAPTGKVLQQIQYVDAPAGSGKTFGFIDKVGELTSAGDNVLIAQPTVDLIQQTVGELKHRFHSVYVNEIHKGNSSSPVLDITKYLFYPHPKPHALFITQSALERLKADFKREYWHLIVDEIPQVTRIFDENLSVNHGIITAHISATPLPSVNYDLLSVHDYNALGLIAMNRDEDKVQEQFREVANTLLSPRWQSYVDPQSYKNLLHSTGVRRRLTVFSLFQPSIFEGFKSVTIAGACFQDSLLFRYWSTLGINFVEAANPNLRFKEHHNGDELTLLWAVVPPWSKSLASQKEGKVLQMMEEAALKEFGEAEFLFAENKGCNLFQGIPNAHRLPNDPHGLNTYQHIQNVAFLPARNLKPAHCKFLERMMGLTGDEIRNAIHRQAAYQAIMRGALRNPDNHEPKRAFVPDLGTAEWLQSLFPGAQLRKLNTDFENLGLSLKRGRQRAHGSNAEKQKAFREKKKEERAKELNALLSFEPPNDVELSNLHPTKTRYEMSINSNNVTTFRGSLFVKLSSKYPYYTFTTTDIGEFEEDLRYFYSNRCFKTKEENRLICPSLCGLNDLVATQHGLNNIKIVNGIWVDIDGGDLLPKEFSELFPHVRMTIYSTFRSTKASVRYRVYIPTETTMTAKQYDIITHQLLNEIRSAGYSDKTESKRQKVHGFDTSKFHAASLFYLPCQPLDPSGRYFNTFKKEGRKPLNPEEWVRKYVAEEEDIPFNETFMEETWHSGLRGSEVDQDRLDRAIEEWRVPDHAHHEDNRNFFSLALKLVAAGCDESTIRQILREEAQCANTPEDRIKQIPSIINSLRSYNIRGTKSVLV